jgi:hypothetical protein
LKVAYIAGNDSTADWTGGNTGGTQDLVGFIVEIAAGGVTADRITVTTQPANTVVGQTMPNIVARAEDGSGNLDTSITADAVLAWDNNPSSAPAPAGTLTQAAVAGVWTFDDIVVNTLQTAATFGLTSAGLTDAETSGFDITAGSGGTDVVDPLGRTTLVIS